ncbi:MAG: sigma-70 family RNA polymerase sigma factor [Clostridia bacterium]|nr:sigma-70 family RNA polymerase sigma factor [Clostridia bacterium]
MDHTKDIDLDLCLSKISRCDEFALEELYRAFAKPIYRFSLMNLQDPSLAEDAMQETFIRIMSYSATYKLGTNARAWIFRIAKNACMDILAKKLPVTDDETMARISDEYQIDDVTENIVLKDAIGRLTPVEREILSLYIYSGLKQTEIASVMRIPYIKVRSHYKYAIQKLRKELSEK